MSLNVGLSYLFSAFFIQLQWMPHGGLALANSVATALEAAVLILLMHRRLGGVRGRYILAGTAKGLLAGCIMGIGIWFWYSMTALMPFWFVVIGGVAVGGTIFTVVGLLTGIPEIKSLLAYFIGRLQRIG
jgi:putative peptidoglycan lipid II flippase